MFASRTNWNLAPNPLALALDQHRRSGRELLDLTASNPTTCGFHYPEREIRAALADPRALAYRPESKGLLEARQAIARYYSGRRGFSGGAPGGAEVDPERILLTSGTSEAYTHVFRLLCEPGDEVLFPAPSYPLFEYLAGLSDLRPVPYTLVYDHGWQVDLASVRAALTPRSRAILLVHPNNPTGSFIKATEAAEIGALCAEREMAVVADEVFLDYSAASSPPGPAATFALDDRALTFTLSGLSKVSLLPQMKLAWMVVSGPQALAEGACERLEVIADTYLSPGTPVQLAAAKFLELRDGMQKQLRARITENLAGLGELTRQVPAITCLEREGGWYAVLRVPANGGDEALAVALLERHSVLVHAGHFFDFPQEGYLVLSLITPQEQFREAVARLAQWFSRP